MILRELPFMGLLLMLATAEAIAKEPVVIVQQDKAFSEDVIQLEVGETVRFRNDDRVTHSIYSRTEGLSFNILSQSPGSVDEIKFDAVGIADVRCAVHPEMRMRIEVQGIPEDVQETLPAE